MKPEKRTILHYVKNTSWMMASRIYRLAIAFGISVVTARYLQTEQFGVLSYAISFVMLFSVLGSLGMDEVLVRELVGREGTESPNNLLAAASFLKLLGNGAMVLLVIGTAFLVRIPQQTRTIISVVCIAYLCTSLARIAEKLFEARVMGKWPSLAQAAAVTASALATGAFIWGSCSTPWFAWVRVIEASVLLGVLVVFTYRFFPSMRAGFRCNKATMGLLLRAGAPLILTGAFIQIYMRIDQIMIQHFLGPSAVGCYAVAVRLSEAWYFVPTVIASSLFPAVLAARTMGGDVYRSRLQLLYEAMTWLGIAIAAPITVVSGPVIRLVFGAEYASAAPVLAFYVWAGVFVFQGVARVKWIVAEGLQRYAAVFTGASCIINVALNWVLIPTVGLTGAALATVISCASSAVLIPVLFKPTRPSALALIKAFWPCYSIKWILGHIAGASD